MAPTVALSARRFPSKPWETRIRSAIYGALSARGSRTFGKFVEILVATMLL